MLSLKTMHRCKRLEKITMLPTSYNFATATSSTATARPLPLLLLLLMLLLLLLCRWFGSSQTMYLMSFMAACAPIQALQRFLRRTWRPFLLQTGFETCRRTDAGRQTTPPRWRQAVRCCFGLILSA